MNNHATHSTPEDKAGSASCKTMGGVDSQGQELELLNFYECVNCGDAWEDVWSCACDDECGVCGTVMSPYDSRELGP